MEIAEHDVAPEDVMAYVDGELPVERAATVEAHVAQCARCLGLVEELRLLSREVAVWQVEPTPVTLRPPTAGVEPLPSKPPSSWTRRWPAWQIAAVPIVPMLGLLWLVRDWRTYEYPETLEEGSSPVASGLLEYKADAESRGGQSVFSPQTPAVTGQADPVSRSPKIVRTATVRIVASDIDAARLAVERIVADVGGFVGRIDVTGARGESRSLNATLRVPAERLPAALTALKQLGQVMTESQAGDDVTEQVVDLEARLANARTTEKRLAQVLQQRTGDVADVLAVEREIARVRQEIERMDGERTNLDRRVTYATLTLGVTEERKAALDLGPLTVPAQLRNAGVDGLRQASETAVHVSLFIIRVAPTLMLWGVLAWPVLVIVRRLRAQRQRGVA